MEANLHTKKDNGSLITYEKGHKNLICIRKKTKEANLHIEKDNSIQFT